MGARYHHLYGTIHDFGRLRHQCLWAMETVHILRGVGVDEDHLELKLLCPLNFLAHFTGAIVEQGSGSLRA